MESGIFLEKVVSLNINNVGLASQRIINDYWYTYYPDDSGGSISTNFGVWFNGYFRLSHDGRLLFGGGESYGYRFPADIKALVRKPMLEIFPQLEDTRLDYAWGGTLAITMKRLPLLARLGPNVLTASGYSGHGVGTAVHAGRLLAEAVRGQSAGFDAMASLPVPGFPGGAALRTPLLALAMSWYALRDRIGI